VIHSWVRPWERHERAWTQENTPWWKPQTCMGGVG
jgi:hypothetical protein